jgi:hypothetical protein
MPILTTSAGGSIAIIGGLVAQMSQSRREREARREERAAVAAAGRKEFETETIRRVMDALNELTKVVNSIHYRRMDEWGKENRWASVEAIGRREDYSVAELEVMRHLDRLLRRDLPALGWRAVLAAREVINATDEEQATDAIFEMSARAAEYSTALGDRLRELYGES